MTAVFFPQAERDTYLSPKNVELTKLIQVHSLPWKQPQLKVHLLTCPGAFDHVPWASSSDEICSFVKELQMFKLSNILHKYYIILSTFQDFWSRSARMVACCLCVNGCKWTLSGDCSSSSVFSSCTWLVSRETCDTVYECVTNVWCDFPHLFHFSFSPCWSMLVQHPALPLMTTSILNALSCICLTYQYVVSFNVDFLFL